jgi:hypothetical protein
MNDDWWKDMYECNFGEICSERIKKLLDEFKYLAAKPKDSNIGDDE